MSSQQGRGRRFLIPPCVLGVALIGVNLSQHLEAQEAGIRAIVVEAVAPGSAGHKAGILPGDVLTSWERIASPPANPSAARGNLVSPFDLAEIEIEQAPRGAVTVLGSRGAQRLALAVPPGRWQISARPAMSPRVSEGYAKGQALSAKGQVDAAVAAWRVAADDAARGPGGGTISAWLFLEAATVLRNANRMAAAHAAIREGLAFAERSRDRAAIAGLLQAQAQTYERQKDAVRAERSYRALIATRQGTGPENLAVAKTMVDLAFVAIDNGDSAGGEQTLKKAAAIQRRFAPDSVALGRSLANLGRLAEMREDADAAETLMTDATALLERAVPGTLDAASSLGNLGDFLWRRGELAEAAALHERSLGILERLDPASLDVAASLTNLSNVTSDRGNLAEAEKMARRALSIYQLRAPGTAEEAKALNNLANQLQDRGDLQSAEEYHLQALAIRERIAPNSLDLAASFHNIGNLSSLRGDVTRAEDYYKRALAIVERLAPGSLDAAKTLNNLGMAAAERADPVAAEAFLLRALAIKQRHAPGSPVVAATLSNLGELAETRGDYPTARDLYDSARTLLEKTAPEGLELGTILGNLSDVAALRGDPAEAARLSERALAVIERLAPASDSHAQALRRIGLQAFKKGDLARAATFFERAIDALESQTTRLGGSNEVRTAFAGRSHDIYVEYLDTLMALDQPARAFDVLERSRARALLMVLAERDLVLDGDLSPELVQARRKASEEYDQVQESLAGLNPSKEAAEVARLQTRLRDLRESRARVIDSIRAASPRLAALQYPKPLNLVAMQEALDAGTILLSYDITKDKSRLFVVERSAEGGQARLTVHTIQAGDAALREQVEALRRQIERQADSRDLPGPAFLELSRRLFDILIAPAQSAIASADRVLISPDGPLNSLPFAALIRSSPESTDRSWQYLVEWKPLHTVVSATVYAELKKASPRVAEPATLVAFGDPLYPVRTDSTEDIANTELRGMLRRGYTLASLPATRAEVEALKRTFGDRATTYLGAEATEGRAKSIGKTRYLHFATHGFLDGRSPLNSALVLTVPSQRREGEENGLLQAWEIFEQVRIDADLVTLSACETALGAELAGEGLIGLTRAFHYAGARTVLASLWRVSDDSTADLMASVYAHLKAGVPKDEALRRAQREAIKRPETSSPFHWAAFTLSGDWR